MSRIGKLPISIPDDVDVTIDKNVVNVKGKLGELQLDVPRGIVVDKVEGEIIVKNTKGKNKTAIHGTTRALIHNMVLGVSEGWSKELEMVGTGYRSEVKGEELLLTVGYSHPVVLNIPKGIEVAVEKTKITIKGIDKELVGHFAALARASRPPEPYKGKGVKYVGEHIRRKAGKAAKGAEGAE